jgi:hypothetical protein
VYKTGQTVYGLPCIAPLEASVHQEQNNHEPGTVAAQIAGNKPGATAMPGEGTEANSDVLTGGTERGALDGSRREGFLVARERAAIQELFVTRHWHRPYAEALLETDRAKLPALIAVAGEVILARYAELAGSQVPSDEIPDLQHAVLALSQLSAELAANENGRQDVC